MGKKDEKISAPTREKPHMYDMKMKGGKMGMKMAKKKGGKKAGKARMMAGTNTSAPKPPYPPA